jgi:hypothetical protein
LRIVCTREYEEIENRKQEGKTLKEIISDLSREYPFGASQGKVK